MITDDTKKKILKLSAMLFLIVWDKILRSPTYQVYFKLKLILNSTPNIYSQSQEAIQWHYPEIYDII